MRLINSPFKVFSYFFLLSQLAGYTATAQSYGLRFSSYETVQDRRTSLDLSPGKALCFKGNIRLSFDISFFPNSATYFGDIFRIIEDDHRNIDLVYTQAKVNHFNLIVGETLSNVSFDIDSSHLFHTWNKLIVQFDMDNDQVIIQSGKRILKQKGLHLKKNACYKILFGANSIKPFQTTDVPPMKIRDIQIEENQKLKYNWPLNEQSGSVAHEIVAGNDAAVGNPLWITALHHDWQLLRRFTVNGIASVAFNSQKENLFIIATDSLYNYSGINNRWKTNGYRDKKIMLNTGNQSIFDPYHNSLYNVDPDQRVIVKYDFATQSWDKKTIAGPTTTHWHANKFISAVDSSLYVIGGYGQLIYKNDVLKCDLHTGRWAKQAVTGDFFMPRYLAGLGISAKGDVAYILGGYGNNSGQQILNPKITYDMVKYSVKDQRFKKLFNLKIEGEDIAFANSLVINDKSQCYYGLVFPMHKYNSGLQLLRGSLNSPGYKLVGGIIPYEFYDIHSFADLYYCTSTNNFIAVTLMRNDNNQTIVSVYSLLSPPFGGSAQVSVAATHDWYYLIFGLLAVGGAILLYFRRGKRLDRATRLESPLPPAELSPVIPAAAKLPENQNRTAASAGHHYCNAILLFGDLQVFDAEGAEITKHFTPLIKELFLVILLYSVRWGRGLSSEKLNEILWYDKDAKSARNNRSVNIAKLKSLLEKMSNCHLSKDTGYWKIDFDNNHVYVDYQNYLSIVKEKKALDVQKIQDLSNITQRGNFLSNIEYEWLDTFKSEISNDVIDTYLHFAQSENELHNPELLIEIANFIFYFDPVNEEAMVIKCKALAGLGKHSLAKTAFENFIKEYRAIYGEDFKKDFNAVLE